MFSIAVKNDRDKTLKTYKKKKKESEKARRPKEDLWQECYRLYRAYKEERDDDKSNLFIPYLFGLIETVVPRITNTIFNKKPYMKPLPRQPEDIEGAEAMEVIMDYQMDKVRFEEKMTDGVKLSAIYGTGYVKVYWDKQTETVIKKKKRQFSNPADLLQMAIQQGSDNLSRFKQVKEEKIKYEGVNIDVLDIEDVYVDPFAEDIENARYVIHETLKPFSYIKKKVERGLYELPEDIDLKDIKEDSGNDRQSAMVRQEQVEMANEPNNSDGMVQVAEYWKNDRLIVVLNDRYVVRDEPNPFHHKKIPIVKMVDTRVPHEVYGIGEVEPNRYLQAELNTNRNQRIENVKMAINNMWAYIEGRVDKEDLESKPNGLIPVKPGESIQDVIMPIQQQNINPSAYTEEQTIKQDMQETSGVTKYIRGQQPTGSATATEITSLQREANYRFKEKIRNIVRAMEKIGEMWVQLNQQFMDREQYIRVSDERARKVNYVNTVQQGMPQQRNFEFLQVSPQDIMGEYDMRVASSALEPLADKQVKRQQLLELWQIAMNNGIKLPALFEEITETYDMPEVDKMVEQYKQEMQRQQQLQRLKFQAQNKGNPQGSGESPKSPPSENMNKEKLQDMLRQMGGQSATQ